MIALGSIMLFPNAAYAGDLGAEAENNAAFPTVPITVAAEKTEVFAHEEQFQAGEIVITETSENSFSENRQLRFFIEKEPLSIEVRKSYYGFEEKEKTEISEGTLKAEYEVKDGILIVTIADSDPTEMEFLTISDLIVKKNRPYVALWNYSLYLSSDSNVYILPVVPEFLGVDEYIPPIPKKPLDIEIKIGEKAMLVNRQEKDLRVPAYISDTGAIMLPIKELAEIFPGIIVLWDNGKKETTLLHDVDIIVISVGTEEIKYVSESRILLRGAEIRDGRMFINLRDFCRIWRIQDNEIAWDAAEKAVTINTTVNDYSK